MRLSDTLTRAPAELPEPPGPVRIYSCGPTVYQRIHVGNAVPFVFAMWLRRWLQHTGYDVQLAINITDVNDKIYEAAPGKSAELARNATEWYLEDTSGLGLGRPDFEPRATGTIPEQVTMIEQLIDAGFAYEVDGDVYYRVARFPEYGRLSGQRPDKVEEQEPNPRKEDPRDFALWKANKPGEDTSWDSPWGKGRPGWHIECSAMSQREGGAAAVQAKAPRKPRADGVAELRLRPRWVIAGTRLRVPAPDYLISTLPPTSSIAALIFSASSLATPSLTAFGAASTRSLASLRPRPVSSRTTLMTGILFGRSRSDVAVNSVCSSGGRGCFGAATTGGRGGCNGNGGRGRHAVALLEALDELRQLEHGHLVDRFEQVVLGHDCHRVVSLVVSAAPRRRRTGPSGRGPGRARSPGCGCSPSSRPASVAIGACIAAGELGEEDLAGRQAGEAPDAVSADRPLAEDGAFDRHDLIGAGCVDDGLGRRRLVVAECDRRRADQERAERLPDRVLGGDLQQAVLDDAVGDVLLVRARRISAISFTVRPRYSETISVRLAESASRSSATDSRLASVGIKPSLLGTQPACGGGSATSENVEAPATAPFRLA